MCKTAPFSAMYRHHSTVRIVSQQPSCSGVDTRYPQVTEAGCLKIEELKEKAVRKILVIGLFAVRL
jgi:hypothetical protein